MITANVVNRSSSDLDELDRLNQTIQRLSQEMTQAQQFKKQLELKNKELALQERDVQTGELNAQTNRDQGRDQARNWAFETLNKWVGDGSLPIFLGTPEARKATTTMLRMAMPYYNEKDLQAFVDELSQTGQTTAKQTDMIQGFFMRNELEGTDRPQPPPPSSSPPRAPSPGFSPLARNAELGQGPMSAFGGAARTQDPGSRRFLPGDPGSASSQAIPRAATPGIKSSGTASTPPPLTLDQQVGALPDRAKRRYQALVTIPNMRPEEALRIVRQELSSNRIPDDGEGDGNGPADLPIPGAPEVPMTPSIPLVKRQSAEDPGVTTEPGVEDPFNSIMGQEAYYNPKRFYDNYPREWNQIVQGLSKYLDTPQGQGDRAAQDFWYKLAEADGIPTPEDHPKNAYPPVYLREEPQGDYRPWTPERPEVSGRMPVPGTGPSPASGMPEPGLPVSRPPQPQTTTPSPAPPETSFIPKVSTRALEGQARPGTPEPDLPSTLSLSEGKVAPPPLPPSALSEPPLEGSQEAGPSGRGGSTNRISVDVKGRPVLSDASNNVRVRSEWPSSGFQTLEQAKAYVQAHPDINSQDAGDPGKSRTLNPRNPSDRFLAQALGADWEKVKGGTSGVLGLTEMPSTYDHPSSGKIENLKMRERAKATEDMVVEERKEMKVWSVSPEVKDDLQRKIVQNAANHLNRIQESLPKASQNPLMSGLFIDWADLTRREKQSKIEEALSLNAYRDAETATMPGKVKEAGLKAEADRLRAEKALADAFLEQQKLQFDKVKTVIASMEDILQPLYETYPQVDWNDPVKAKRMIDNAMGVLQKNPLFSSALKTWSSMLQALFPEFLKTEEAALEAVVGGLLGGEKIPSQRAVVGVVPMGMGAKSSLAGGGGPRDEAAVNSFLERMGAITK